MSFTKIADVYDHVIKASFPYPETIHALSVHAKPLRPSECHFISRRYWLAEIDKMVLSYILALVLYLESQEGGRGWWELGGWCFLFSIGLVVEIW